MSNETNTAPPVPGSDAYNAAMIARAESAGAKITPNADGTPAPVIEKKDETKPDATAAAAATQKAERPSYVPEKFWDAEKGEIRHEAWAKSYAELESANTKRAQLDTLNSAVTAAEQKLAAATDDAGKQAAQAELDAAKAAVTEANKPEPAATTGTLADVLAKATDEFDKGQKLSDDTYAALEKQGFSRDYVDAYIEGQTARAELYETKVFSEVGGKEVYGSMVKWAQANYTPAQVQAFDAAVTSGDLAQATAAVQTLKGLYTAANGQPPARRIEGAGPGTPNVDGYFASTAEMTRAMGDPKYARDPAYRAEVAKKIEGSIRLGINLG